MNNKGQIAIALIIVGILIFGAASVIVLKNISSNKVTGNAVAGTGNAVADTGNRNVAANPAPTQVVNDKPSSPAPKVISCSTCRDNNPIVEDVVVPDITVPVITLNGLASVDVEFGHAYADAGATALDDVNGDITISIVTVNPVDTSVLGAYIVTYDVSDVAGNHAIQATRTVNVVPDITAPLIVITAPVALSIVIGADTFTFTDNELTSPQCSIDNATWISCTSGVTMFSDLPGFSSLVSTPFLLYVQDSDSSLNVGSDTEDYMVA